jgi:hypothetical protein
MAPCQSMPYCVSLASTTRQLLSHFKTESNYDLERVIELLDVTFIEGYPLQAVIYITIDGNHNHSTFQG